MKAGFTERDITPKAGMERPGGYGKAFHDGNVHDPCKIRASVFNDGQRRIALVGIDVLSIPKEIVQKARKGIEEACGIPQNAILVGASHSHSAGPLGILPGQYDHASELVQKFAYEESICADPEYMKTVEEGLISAVVEADKNSVDVKCSVGSGCEEKVAFNRRFLMKNGLSYTHPGKCNPDIVKPAGPTDPEVGVIGAWDEKGDLLGCVVNFACHGTTGPGSTSADWIYYLEKTIRAVMGDHVIVVFLNGACGDITQVDNLSPYNIDFGERAARYVGTRVGAEVVKVLVTAEPGDLSPVSAQVDILQIARRKPSASRLARALEIAQSDPNDVDPTEWTFAKEIVLLDALLQKEPIVDVEVQAIQMGPAIFLANPSEYFCQYGLDIKEKSKFPFTFPVELANDSVGYVPTEEAMGEHGGGYETRLTSYSNLEVGAGTKIANALINLAERVTPGKVPEPPKVSPVKSVWSYGKVLPEVE